jgi:hypothetical protein
MFTQLHREKNVSNSLHFLSSIKAAWHGANALKIPSKISFFSRRDGSGSPVSALLRD